MLDFFRDSPSDFTDFFGDSPSENPKLTEFHVDEFS